MLTNILSNTATKLLSTISNYNMAVVNFRYL